MNKDVKTVSIYTEDSGETFLSAADAREDLDQLYEGLKLADAGLFAKTTQSKFEIEYETLREKYRAPISLFELHKDFQKFTALAGHAHTKMNGINPAWEAFKTSGAKVFPLRISIDGDKIIIIGAPQDLEAHIGQQILAINGLKAETWLSRIRSNISADNAGLANAQMRGGEHYFHWLEFGPQERFDFVLSTPDQSIQVSIAAIELAEYYRLPTKHNRPNLSGREAKLLNSDIAYLRPGPFFDYEAENQDAVYAESALEDYKAFIDRSFHNFLDSGASHLILDLRDNPGGDVSYSDPVIAWFASEPFRFTSKFKVRVSPQTMNSNQKRLNVIENPEDSQGYKLAKLYESAEVGEDIIYEFPLVSLRHGSKFTGQVHVLINKDSFSNSVTTAALIQDYGFGTIYGETTADMATTYGAMESFQLDNSGFEVGYAKALIVRPNGQEDAHPLEPDIGLTALASSLSSSDPMLEALVKMIE